MTGENGGVGYLANDIPVVLTSKLTLFGRFDDQPSRPTDFLPEWS